MSHETFWHDMAALARGGLQRFDGQISAWQAGYACLGRRIYCGKGCATCCTLVVNCTFPEAMAIAADLSGEQASRLSMHVEIMLREATECGDLLSWLRRYRQKVGSCPFLDGDKACGVYAVRPASCRSLLATRESRWCGADFAAVPAGEKEAFLASLDRSVVAFPLHYVAATQEWGRELEDDLCREMAVRFGFALSGNLPFLVWLEREHRLSDFIPRGYEDTLALLRDLGAINPLLISLDRVDCPPT